MSNALAILEFIKQKPIQKHVRIYSNDFKEKRLKSINEKFTKKFLDSFIKYSLLLFRELSDELKKIEMRKKKKSIQDGLKSPENLPAQTKKSAKKVADVMASRPTKSN